MCYIDEFVGRRFFPSSLDLTLTNEIPVEVRLYIRLDSTRIHTCVGVTSHPSTSLSPSHYIHIYV